MISKLLIFFASIFLLASCTPVNWKIPECLATCKNNGSIIRIPGTISTFNGCGSFDITVNFTKYNSMSGFNECCNSHDICYNTCDTTKSACDNTFYTCLNTAVTKSSVSPLKKLSNYAIATGMYETVKKLGCPSYVIGFGAACECP